MPNMAQQLRRASVARLFLLSTEKRAQVEPFRFNLRSWWYTKQRRITLADALRYFILVAYVSLSLFYKFCGRNADSFFE